MLSKHFKKVSLFEGDTMDYQVDARKATPQGHHVHGLLSSGWKSLKTILPGIEKDLQERGAHWVHFGKEFRWHHFGKVKAQFDEPMEGPFMSRSCLEGAIYERVKKLKNLEVIERCKVASMVGSAAKIEGVVTEDGELILADFVLDASGRSSKVVSSLATLGLPPIEKNLLPAGLRYSSMRFAPHADFRAPWKALFVTPKPPLSKAAAIFPVSEGEWLVTVSGREHDVMPTHYEEFLQYAEQLQTQEVREALAQATPVSELRHFRYKESRHFCYEKAQMPGNLVVIGDAYCSFNPIFGQGMTVCALEALILDEQLQEGEFDSNQFFKQASKLVKQVWEMITVEDMRHTQLHDVIPLKVKLRQWVSAKLYDKTSEDPELNKKFYEVIHLTRPASDLCTLPVLWKILR